MRRKNCLDLTRILGHGSGMTVGMYTDFVSGILHGAFGCPGRVLSGLVLG